MKKIVVWGLGLVAVGGFLWLLLGGESTATHNPNEGYSHDNYIGAPEDSIADSSPESSGFDRNNDRTPDRVVDPVTGVVTAGPDRSKKDSRDCRNGPGDGRGGPAGGGSGLGSCIGAAEQIADNFGPHPKEGPLGRRSTKRAHDGIRDFGGLFIGDAVDNTPDLFPAINRIGEHVNDGTPDRTNRDNFLQANGLSLTRGDRVGTRDCLAADVAQGECDNDNPQPDVRSAAISTQRAFDRDRTVGRDANATVSDRGTATAGDGTRDRVIANIIAQHDDPGRPARDGTGTHVGFVSRVATACDAAAGAVPPATCGDGGAGNQRHASFVGRPASISAPAGACDGTTCGDRVGGVRDCAIGDLPAGECDLVQERLPERVPDRIARPNADRVGGVRDCSRGGGSIFPHNATNTADRHAGECDGIQDRNTAGTLRDAGRQNHSQPARDTFLTGPADRSRDGRADTGGFGFASPEFVSVGLPSDEGCSFSPQAGPGRRGAGFSFLPLVALIIGLGVRKALRGHKK